MPMAPFQAMEAGNGDCGAMRKDRPIALLAQAASAGRPAALRPRARALLPI